MHRDSESIVWYLDMLDSSSLNLR